LNKKQKSQQNKKPNKKQKSQANKKTKKSGK
jgi:hypothetical protein